MLFLSYEVASYLHWVTIIIYFSKYILRNYTAAPIIPVLPTLNWLRFHIKLRGSKERKEVTKERNHFSQLSIYELYYFFQEKSKINCFWFLKSFVCFSFHLVHIVYQKFEEKSNFHNTENWSDRIWTCEPLDPKSSVLAKLNYTPRIGKMRFELMTPALSAQCSNQLSYSPIKYFKRAYPPPQLSKTCRLCICAHRPKALTDGLPSAPRESRTPALRFVAAWSIH